MIDSAAVKRLYLDANIFIYAFEDTTPLGFLLGEILSASLQKDMPFLVTSELTLSEVLVQPHRKQDEQLIRVYENWIEDGPALKMVPVDRDNLYFASVLRAQHKTLKLPDAIHIVSGIAMECSHMLTNDNDISGSYSIVHRRHGMRGSASLEILRPTELVIENIINGFLNG